MAYYLEIPSGTAYVSIPDTDLFSRTDWRIEVEMGVNAALANFERLVILGRSGNGQAVLEVAAGGPDNELSIQFAPQGGSSQVVITALERSTFEDGLPHIFVISRTSNVLTVTLDGGSFGTVATTDLATLDNDAIGRRANNYSEYNLYRLKAYDAASGGNLLRLLRLQLKTTGSCQAHHLILMGSALLFKLAVEQRYQSQRQGQVLPTQ